MTSAAPAPPQIAPHQRTGWSRGAFRWTAVEPAHVVIAAAALSRLVPNVGPIKDIDVYWHVVLGRQILDTHHIAGAGSNFSFVNTGIHWKTSEWLAEIALAEVQRLFGWRGLIGLRLVLGAALLASLAVVLLRRHSRHAPGRSAWPVAIVYSIAAILASAMIQERPELFSLFFVLWLGTQLPGWFSGTSPRWPYLVAVAVWANIHGYWVLAPGLLLLAAAGTWLDDRSHWRRARSQALWALAGFAAGCVSPIGPVGLLMPFRLHAATSIIVEWQPTALLSPEGILLGTLFALTFIAWARSARSVPPSEILLVLALLVFAGTAFRNVYVTALLYAPFVLDRVSDLLPSPPPKVRPNEGRVFASLMGTAIVVSGIYLGVAATRTSVFPKTEPVAIARYLAQQPGKHRVLDDYNTSGVLIAFGGPRTKVAVDGRADRYGGTYLAHYQDMFSLQGNWAGRFNAFHANAAVVETDGPLAYGLRTLGWQLVLRSNGFSLFEPPSQRGPAAT